MILIETTQKETNDQITLEMISMKDVKETWCIQIDITNRCENKCSNCTHLVKHAPIWDMNLETFKKAVDSLEKWPKVVGIIGGNPILHPQIEEFTEYIASKILNKEKRGIWTSNFFGKEGLVRNNFGVVYYNPHTELVLHQPILCASRDLIKDEATRDNLISSCWLAEQWSPSITPKGCYRCEVMGAFDMALGYNLGLPIEYGWWTKPLSDFQKQISTFCQICSACIPLDPRRDREQKDDISTSNLETFRNSSRIKNGQYVLINEKSFKLEKANIKKWQPERYRRPRHSTLHSLYAHARA
jgi:hypothetical protein